MISLGFRVRGHGHAQLRSTGDSLDEVFGWDWRGRESSGVFRCVLGCEECVKV